MFIEVSDELSKTKEFRTFCAEPHGGAFFWVSNCIKCAVRWEEDVVKAKYKTKMLRTVRVG